MLKYIKFASVFCVVTMIVLSIFGLIFRLMIYPGLSVNAGNAPGTGDLLELIIFLAILAMAGLCMVFGVIAFSPLWREPRSAIVLLITSLIVPPFYYMLHGLLAGQV